MEKPTKKEIEKLKAVKQGKISGGKLIKK